MASVFQGTVGLRIRVALSTDVSDPGVVSIRALKPSGSVVTWTAQIEDASSGIVYYDTQVDDLDEDGQWKINGIWDPDGDDIFYGATACLNVRKLGECCN